MSQTRQYEMTASGLEWLGDIPVNWIMERAKFNFCQSFDRGNKTPELLAATQKYGMYPQRLLEGVVRVMAGTDLQQFKTVHKNDFVISLRSFQGGFERSDYEGVCSPAYQVFHAHKKYDANWLKWFFKNEMFIDAMNALTVGIREGRNIKYEDFANSEIPVPPLPEQAAIAAYLDEKCAAIDGIIAEAKASIEEYKAWKTSVISEAVTKGLDPNAEMKDSGVEWIGKMPKHWSCVPMKFVLNERNQKNDPVVTSERLSLSIDIGVTLYAEKTTNLDRFKEDVSQYKVAHAGDFVLNSMNMIVGAVGIAPLMGCVSPAYYVFYDNDDSHTVAKFCNYIFKNKRLRGCLFSLGQGIMAIDRGDGRVNTCRLKVSRDDLGRIMLPCPAIEEQRKIISFLDKKCAAIDGIIAEKESLITELETYKKSLIFETVTGKRRVC